MKKHAGVMLTILRLYFDIWRRKFYQDFLPSFNLAVIIPKKFFFGGGNKLSKKGLPDLPKTYQTYPKLTRLTQILPNLPTTYPTYPKLPRVTWNLPNLPETYQTYIKTYTGSCLSYRHEILHGGSYWPPEKILQHFL